MIIIIRYNNLKIIACDRIVSVDVVVVGMRHGVKVQQNCTTTGIINGNEKYDKWQSQV